MVSIFGFYFITTLLRQMDWPRRRSLFNSEAVINTLIFDATIDQMIDFSAGIGACRPKLALQIIATMLRGTDWESEKSLDMIAEVDKLKKVWIERGNNNPREIVKPLKFSKAKELTDVKQEVISAKQFKDKNVQLVLENYFYESLLWGLTNPDSFKSYFEAIEKSQTDKLSMYKKVGLAVDYIPTLDQILKEAEEMLKGYEKEVRPLLPISQKLIKDALSLGVEVNN